MTDQDAVERILQAFEKTEKSFNARFDDLEGVVKRVADDHSELRRRQERTDARSQQALELAKKHDSGFTRAQRSVSESDAKHASDIAAVIVQVGNLATTMSRTNDAVKAVASDVTDIKTTNAARGKTDARLMLETMGQTNILKRLDHFVSRPGTKAALFAIGALLGGAVGQLMHLAH